MAEPARPTAGHNRPPLETVFTLLNEALPDTLRDGLAAELERTQTLVANSQNVPDTIEDDAGEEKATDIISQMKKHASAMDSRRLGINAGARDAQNIINGFFEKHLTNPVTSAIKRITPGLEDYKRRKAEKERRRREEEEARKRAAAEAARREAEEAARKKREAEEARARAEREAAEAEERKRKAQVEARLAEERRRKAEEDARDAERRRKEAEAIRIEEEAKAAEAKRKRDREAAERRAAEAKARAEEEERRAAEAKKRAEDEEREKAAARQRAQEERERQEQAEEQQRAERERVAAASRESKTAQGMAAHANRDADRATRATKATQSELTYARGEYGGGSGLREVWKGEVADKTKITTKTMTALWPHLSEDAIQTAINSYVRVHKGDAPLPGIAFFIDDGLQVR